MRITILLSLIFLCSQSIIGQVAGKWVEDYEAAKRFMSEAYANLDWAIETKRLDLVSLDLRTMDELRSVKSDDEGRKILERFLATFSDGHLRLIESFQQPSSSNSASQISTDSSADAACAALGYKFRFHRFSLPFDKAKGFAMTGTGKSQFPSGVFPFENGKKVGVLRIGLFGPDGYLGNCIETWNEFRTEKKGVCDTDCKRKFSQLVEERLTKKLIDEINILKDQKIHQLIVDIGGNGGGTNWVRAAAKALSPKPILNVRSGFIRHPHWAQILEGDLEAIDHDLRNKDLGLELRKHLNEARFKIADLARLARTPCDRNYVWKSAKPKDLCNGVLLRPDFSVTSLKISRDELAGLKSQSIFMSAEDASSSPIFDGKLIVLVDSKTASASENFASWMQYNKGADVVGEVTLGAGCGYVNGGTNYVLPNSKLRLRMPDCARYRVDGINEVSGIVPDTILWQKEDGRDERLTKLLAYLSTAK